MTKYVGALVLVSFLFWIPIRLSVTVVGSIINAVSGETFPLGGAWINWLCVGLAVIGGLGYLIYEHRKQYGA